MYFCCLRLYETLPLEVIRSIKLLTNALQNFADNSSEDDRGMVTVINEKLEGLKRPSALHYDDIQLQIVKNTQADVVT